MKKGQLKALFIEAKGTGQKYIGVMIQTEGSSEPEVIINPKENFNAKFDYYMAAYDDDLILIAAKGKKDIRITGAAAGASFEDIQSQLIDEKASSGWKEQIADEELFEICMNGDDAQFKKGITELQKAQNEYILQKERENE